MAESSTPTDVIGFLDYWLVKKAPFQIPEKAKEWIVKYGPWIDLVLLILFVPIIFAAIGFTAFLTPYAAIAGTGYTMWYWAGIVVLVLQLALQIFALPGLFARKLSGWTLLFYSEVVNCVYSLVSGQIVGAVVGVIIGLYVLFQIREKYAK